MNIKQNKIWCHKCFKWIDKYIDTILIENSVYCLLCYDILNGIQTHLGYDSELFPCKYYYIYHKKGQCRCIQEETNCNNNELNCDNILGKIVYEDDIKEE